MSTEDPAELQEKVVAIREDLGTLVGELDRRRHRLAKPALVGGVMAAAAALTGILLWRRRRRPGRLARLRRALDRAAAHPERVAKPEPSAGRKLLVAVGTAVASVAARRIAQQWLFPPPASEKDARA